MTPRPRCAGLVALSLLALFRGTILAQEYHEVAKLTASDAADSDYFGNSISINGDTLVVGATRDDCAAGDNCGAAYVYTFNGSAWIQQAKLTASDAAAFDNFGGSVSISGDTIVVGAYANDCVAGLCGSAYVFVKPGGGWSDMAQTAKLTASNAADGDWFGYAVSISGDTIVVGALFADCAAGIDCGTAYVFVKPGGGWSDMTETAKLTASDAAEGDELGYSVSISGETIVAGAALDDCAAGVRCGSACVFVKPGGGWSDMTQTAKLTASDAAANDYFGHRVAISGDTIVTGALLDDCAAGNNCGSAYVFVKPGGGWSDMTQTAKLTASDAADSDNVGYSASISGDTIVVGAYRDDLVACVDCGSVYVFVKPGGGWSDMTETAKLASSDAAAGDYFGFSLSFSEGTIVVGALFDDGGAGADCGSAYVFGPLVLYVDAAATGANNGTSWTDAFTTLQDALAESDALNDSLATEIWVADGTYMPDGGRRPVGGSHVNGTGIRTATFQLLNGVALFGGFAGGESLLSQRNPNVNVATLSGDLLGNDTPVACLQDAPDCAANGNKCLGGSCITASNNGENSYHVVTGSGTDASVVLDGFTMTAGNADATAPDWGGGMYVAAGSPTVSACTFHGNSGQAGAGMYNRSGSSPIVINCTFSGNAGLAGAGGGMLNANGGNPTVTNCTFHGNYAVVGAGMYNVVSNPTVTHCTFSDNSAQGSGGGMGNSTSSNPRVNRCVFEANTATASGGGMHNGVTSGPVVLDCTFSKNTAIGNGGALVNFDNSSASIINCLFVDNTAGNFGGGIRNNNSSPTIINATFTRNTANTFGGGIYNGENSNTVVQNSIVWANIDDADGDGGGPFTDESAQIHVETGSPVVNYSIVQGGWTGTGTNNSAGDPVFVDPDGADNVVGTADDNLGLTAASPAINAANTAALPLDSDDADSDGNTTEPYPLDLAGAPRILESDVDMGAYEFFTDCDANGLPDVCDLVCGPPDGPCDLPGCGMDMDCNGNLIHDTCDIAGCQPTDCPMMNGACCDDCNLNGIPDGCDIANCPLPNPECKDINPFDGVPDGCVTGEEDPNCTVLNEWSCTDNWPTTIPDDYPDNNTTMQNYSVTLPPTVDLTLDVPVEIDTLRIQDNASLTVDQGPLADLSIVAAGGLLVEGDLNIDNGRSVMVTTGPTTIGPRGVVYVAPAGGAAVGTLAAQDVTILPADDNFGGKLYLDGASVTTIAGTLLLEGTGAEPCCPLEGFGVDCPARAGANPSPTLIGKVNPSLGIGQDLLLLDHVALGFVMAARSHGSPKDLEQAMLGPGPTVTLAGNFQNQSKLPACFIWSIGEMTMTGTNVRFEVAGVDVGQSLSGFSVAGHTNFSMPQLNVAPNATVSFVNEHFNTTSSQPCSEALYVHDLILGAGSTTTLNNCRVYYETISFAGAQVNFVGCGQLLHVGDGPFGPCRLHGDVVPGGCLVDVDDLLCVLDAFVLFPADPPAPCSQAVADMEGNIDLCVPDGLVDSTDILGVLAAFVATPNSPANCPAPVPPGACTGNFGSGMECRDETYFPGGMSATDCFIQTGGAGTYCGDNTLCDPDGSCPGGP